MQVTSSAWQERAGAFAHRETGSSAREALPCLPSSQGGLREQPPQQRKDVIHVIRKSILFLLLTLIASVGIFGFAAPQAAYAATSCHASTCKNLDPTTTVGPDGVFCNGDAFRQERDNDGTGYLENWFSVNCEANWTVAQAPSGTSIKRVAMGVCLGTISLGLCTSTVVYYTDSIPGVSCMTPIYVCNAGAIPSGATHWFTNMVDGSHPVQSRVLFTNGTELITAFH